MFYINSIHTHTNIYVHIKVDTFMKVFMVWTLYARTFVRLERNPPFSSKGAVRRDTLRGAKQKRRQIITWAKEKTALPLSHRGPNLVSKGPFLNTFDCLSVFLFLPCECFSSDRTLRGSDSANNVNVLIEQTTNVKGRIAWLQYFLVRFQLIKVVYFNVYVKRHCI